MYIVHGAVRSVRVYCVHIEYKINTDYVARFVRFSQPSSLSYTISVDNMQLSRERAMQLYVLLFIDL